VVMLSHSIPGTIFAATITATVLMSHRCKKRFRDSDILFGRLPLRRLTGRLLPTI